VTVVQYYAEEGNRLYWFASMLDRREWVGEQPDTRHTLNWHQMDRKYGRNKKSRRLQGRMEPYGRDSGRMLHQAGGGE
jgi:hypothetical protein